MRTEYFRFFSALRAWAQKQAKNRARAWALGLCVLAAGCGAPYVHIDSEFNRTRAGFGQEPQDIKDVTICYSNIDTAAETVAKMADARCAEFGKTAVFESQDMTTCPMLTPDAANFRCVKQDAAMSKKF